MYISAKFHSSPNHDGQQLCKCLRCWLLVPPSPKKANLATALQVGQKGKKYSKASFVSINGYYFPSFMFILLRFKSHQTLYISVSLAQSFNTLLSYSMFLKFVLPYSMWVVLWEMIPCNTTLRDDFYAVLVWEILVLSTELSIWVFRQTPNLETAKPGWLTRLEKYDLSSLWLEKLGHFLVEFYVASVSIFYFMVMYW